ncbi:uncharacterized protein EDB93DRAFT_1104944 [Suillus bovinus]|uniref:uncharacterized protein n=1 Tax=Suillus bovinus TaxID=48563 RepID=UPI001B864959|nr:uncharacterized protein EDB93DRAFT_1104944 [Suillus bovinus]KAG2144378.1 hypothetical protein EDB93DRAFT_1104944 [Suillus bovinus]
MTRGIEDQILETSPSLASFRSDKNKYVVLDFRLRIGVPAAGHFPTPRLLIIALGSTLESCRNCLAMGQTTRGFLRKNTCYTYYYGVLRIRNRVDMGDQIQNEMSSGGCKSTKDVKRECHKLGDLRCESDRYGIRGARTSRRRSKRENSSLGKIHAGSYPLCQTRSMSTRKWIVGRDGLAQKTRLPTRKSECDRMWGKILIFQRSARHGGRSRCKVFHSWLEVSWKKGGVDDRCHDAELTRRRRMTFKLVATWHSQSRIARDQNIHEARTRMYDLIMMRARETMQVFKMSAPGAGMDGEHENDSPETVGSGAKEEVVGKAQGVTMWYSGKFKDAGRQNDERRMYLGRGWT